MKNTQNIIRLLSEAFKATELAEVRFHIMQAIRKCEKIEQKQARKEQITQAQTWHNMLLNGVTNPNTPKRTLDIINQMLEIQKKKLNDTTEKENTPDQLLND
jgi:hypothetical protein